MSNDITFYANNNLAVQSQNIYIIIEINSKKYAFRALDVLEIIKVIELDSFNQMFSCILGVIRYKKEPIGVLDLREIFKEERKVYGLNSKIIIVNNKKSKVAFIVDKVIDILNFEQDEIQNNPYTEQTPFFDGIYAKEEERIYILNVEEIISYIYKNASKFDTDGNQQQKFLVNDELSREILKKRKTELYKISNIEPQNISLYDSGVSFNIDEYRYYMNMASIKEFYKVGNTKIIKVPCTKDFIYGIINIKGEYITVIDIKMLYHNRKTTLKEKSTVIVLNSNEFKIGILADEIKESLDVNFNEISQNSTQSQDKIPEFIKDKEVYQIIYADELLKDERLIIC